MRLKKRRGVFYTPARLAEIVVAWGIRSKDDIALEPSFGGCEFIAALQRRFIDIGNKNPLRNIYGCDVDRAAFTKHLPEAIGVNFDNDHFRKTDFLSVQPCAFQPDAFTVALGNPPYVSYHNMFKSQRGAALLAGRDEEFQLSGMASLWAYFVFHALKFLRENGRMVWLLPGSLLHADYGKELLYELARRFHRVGVISLSERIFLDDGTSETTEVLLCDGFRRPRSDPQVEIASAVDVESCAALLLRWPTNEWTGAALNGRAVPALAGSQPLSIFEQIRTRSDVVRIADIGRIAIGIVTGANRIFVVNETTARQSKIPESALKPIFAKFANGAWDSIVV